MANSFAAAAETAIDRFYTRAGEIISTYRGIVRIKQDQREQTTYKPVDLSGFTAFTAQASDGARPVADDLTYAGAGYTAPAYEKRVTITEYDVAKNPGIMADIADAMLDKAADTIASLVWGALAAPDTTTHPEDGAGYTANGGGTVYFADDFLTPNAQANLATAALDWTSLRDAKKILRSYKTKDGSPADFAAGPLTLVVESTLEQTANDLMGRDKEIYDGATLQGSGSMNVSSVLVNPYQTDTNDWMLINGARSPFVLWLPRSPYLRVQPEPGAGRWEVYAGYEAGMAYMPYEGGFVFSKVA